MEGNKKMKFLHKFRSIKTLITIWACLLITIIVIKNIVEFNNIAFALCAVPLAYLPVNAYQKKIEGENTNGQS